MISRLFPLVLFLSLTSNLLHAQFRQRVLMPDNRFYVSLLGGLNFPHTDVQSTERGYLFGLSGGYSFLPYLGVDLDLQKGRLQEGFDAPSPIGGQYKNDYLNATLSLSFTPVQLIQPKDRILRTLLNFSFGAGLTILKSDVNALDAPAQSIGYVGSYDGFDLMVPVQVGYAVPIYTFFMGQQISLGAQYRYFFSTTDKLDGYQPTTAANKSNDVFSQVHALLRFSF